MENTIFELQYALDTFYFLVMGALVMWMAAGFAMLEAGLVRAKNTTEILLKNISLYAVACTMYMICGYTIMYGTAEWFLSGIAVDGVTGAETPRTYSQSADFFFQVVFVATAMSIVSGAVAERMKLWAFLLFAVVMTGFIYPMEGSWTWNKQPVFGMYTLADLGFSDFAGSGIVHLAGASAAPLPPCSWSRPRSFSSLDFSMDPFGRHIDYLRISVTDRCNERCLYCMPQGCRIWGRATDELTAAELERIARVAAGLGVRKFRLTGGEPLARSDVVEIVRRLSAIPGVEGLGLSTNGTRLANLAGPLRAAGLRTVNISLDALDPGLYRRITGGEVAAVLRGIRAAVVNCRFVKPLDRELLLRLRGEYSLLVTVEENVIPGGFGAGVHEALAETGADAKPLFHLGVPDRFVTHGSRSELLEEVGLTPSRIAARVLEWAAGAEK